MLKNNFDIIFENDRLIAINKPSGMLTIPDREQSERSLKEILTEKYGSIFTVHRIDRDTSGLVVFAKNQATHKYLSGLFEERKVQKFYLGIVIGQPEPASGNIEAPIAEHPVHKGKMHIHRKGKASHTGYKVMDGNKYYSLVEFQLYTGRTHQIRVHTKEIGHPLACDSLYGNGEPVLLSSIKKKYKLSKAEEEERPIIGRLALHAYRLIFEDEQAAVIDLETPVPKEFRALMQQLKKSG